MTSAETEPQAFAPGALIDGRYRVEHAIGRGAMGSVVLAVDEGLDRRVAIKIVADLAATVPDFEKRFRREASALASIRNPYVVTVWAAGRHAGSMFFVMEYVEGRDLERIIEDHEQRGTHVPLARALAILEQVSTGLSAIHLAGFVHRDIKPANFVIEEATGRPVVVDLGLAVNPERDPDVPIQGLGTAAYAAPEQIADTLHPRVLSPATDVYALACSAFELFTGSPPFVHENPDIVAVKHITEIAPLLSSRRPDLAALDPILARALEKDPRARQASATQLTLEIREALGMLRESISAPGPPRSIPPVEDVLRVLIVDDDPDFGRLIAASAHIAFRDAQVRVEVVSSGRDAIDKVFVMRPHLLLLDYEMPGMNGIETLTRIRALPFGEAIRAVVVSAHDHRWRFSVLGVSDFVTKGDSPAALTRALRAVRDRYGFTAGR